MIPTIAREIHRRNITSVCEDALRSANLKLKDVDGIAATVKPGLPMSLAIGTNFGKYLAKTGNKPFIPIHHMEAHALTARMTDEVDFPYLVLLVSGGHCLLAIVESVDKFYLLGSSEDIAPGQILEKLARRLKLRNIKEFSNTNGGRAVELAAEKATNLDQFEFKPVMTHQLNCTFSFSGMQNIFSSYIKTEEEKHNITADMVIPDVYNLCAATQMAVITHICQRTQRAMEYIDRYGLFPNDKRTLVASGGVACNNLLAKALRILSAKLGYNFVRTQQKFCTDNGVMIAWNGVERWIANKGVLRDATDIERVCVEKKVLLGEDWRNKVEEAHLKCKWIKIKSELS